MKKRSAWFAAWFAVLIIGVVAMMAVAPMGKAAEQKQFIVGFDAEFPPYGYMDDNGEYVGFDLDLAEEVCKRNGWKLVKRPIAWDSKDSELATGAISCIWNGFTMNGREDDYTWSTAYVDNSQVVIVKKDSNVHKLSDLKGKRLIVQSDSSALAALTGDDATKENKKLAASLKDLQQQTDKLTDVIHFGYELQKDGSIAESFMVFRIISHCDSIVLCCNESGIRL